MLAACFSTLFLAMITNCMFFQSGNGNSTTLISIGPIDISSQQLYASVISSLIVVPPVLIITMVFSKSGRKPNKTTAVKYETIDRGEKNQWPWWCICVGWILTFLAVSLSAFFTILYSFEWGQEKSTAWLQAFLFSFFQSAVVVQPVKVCVFFFKIKE